MRTSVLDRQESVSLSAPRRTEAVHLPAVSPAVLQWFAWYSRRYIGRHFHGLRIALHGRPRISAGTPLVIYLNHASWWDPLTVLLITQHLFPAHRFYAPIDAAALQRYGILRKIGMYGVERGTLRGARQFLHASNSALSLPSSGLCITPQGRFADVRERPMRFESGLAQLALHRPDVLFLPLAIEYTFWEERLPEVLARVGEPVDLANLSRAQDVNDQLEAAMITNLDTLRARSLERDGKAFENILSGKAGVGGVYDVWRRLRTWLRGERFVAEHSPIR